MTYREITFELDQFEIYSEVLIASLSAIGFDSFQEDSPYLKAYVSEEDYDPKFEEHIEMFKGHYRITSNEPLQKINWNEEWEKNFQPLPVDDFCYIRAPFHEAKEGFDYELIIEPKMSFGTGHHATTQNMIRLMRKLKAFDSVLDVGSGTGILAILATKMGAKEVYATDIEEWAYENMQENFERNHTPENIALLGSLPLEKLEDKLFDLVLANINKNVLLEQIPLYSAFLKQGSSLCLSGFYSEDERDIDQRCQQFGLQKINSEIKDNWVASQYYKA